MRQVPKTIRKAVRVLVDPIPEFVSLVGRGANQTPFRVVKVDPTALPEGDEMPNPNKHEAVIRQGDKVIKRADILKIEFTAANFPTEDAVKVFLTDRGYEDFQVEKADNGFTVAGRPEDEFEAGSASVIELRTGAMVTVGKLAVAKVADAEDPPATPTTDDVPTDPPEGSVHKDADAGDGANDAGDEADKTKKADEADKGTDKDDPDDVDPYKIIRAENADLAKKFDDFIAQFSNADNLKDVMKTGADGLPPGMHEVTGAMFTALRNVLGRGDNDLVEGIAGEFAEMVVKLAKAFPFATVTQQSDDVERAADKTNDDSAMAKVVRDAMKSAIGDIGSLAENINTIKAVTDKTATQTTEVVTRMTELDKRIDSLEKVRQTRKGADHDAEKTEKSEEAQKADAHGERMRRNTFGIG